MLLIWRHAANIQKLLAGTESKLGKKAAEAPASPSPKKSKTRRGVHKP
jgi:glycerol-3-phosphate acyltransferase PlsY